MELIGPPVGRRAAVKNSESFLDSGSFQPSIEGDEANTPRIAFSNGKCRC